MADESPNKTSRLIAKLKTVVSRDSGSESGGASTNEGGGVSERRREQIRRAQKLHRQRKAEHSQRLNVEIADLRAKDTAKTSRIQHLENTVMFLSDLLNKHGIRHELPSLQNTGNAVVQVIQNQTGPTITQHIQVTMPNCTHALAIDPINMSMNTNTYIPIDLSDAQIGIDFILHLEHRCLYHHHGPAPDNDFLLGHSHMMQSSIMARAPPLVKLGNDSDGSVNSKNSSESIKERLPPSSNWSVPSEELERLLMFSNQLRLPDEITPVQAWSRIRERGQLGWSPNAQQLTQFMLALKSVVVCYGFGAVLDKSAFEQLSLQYCGPFAV